jgi:hypothetical protein
LFVCLLRKRLDSSLPVLHNLGSGFWGFWIQNYRLHT